MPQLIEDLTLEEEIQRCKLVSQYGNLRIIHVLTESLAQTRFVLGNVDSIVQRKGRDYLLFLTAVIRELSREEGTDYGDLKLHFNTTEKPYTNQVDYFLEQIRK